MKIAEALLLRADMQKKLASLRERIGKNAVVQEGDQPHEDPAKLMDEAYAVLKELESLVCRINQANLQHSLLQHAIAHTHKEPDRYSMTEIKWVATLKVGSLQRQAEDLAKAIRELNAAIQETNWKVELAD